MGIKSRRGGLRVPFPGWVLLPMTLTALVAVSLTLASPGLAAPKGVLLTDAIPRTEVPFTEIGKTFLTVTKEVTYRSGKIVLSSTPDGSGDLGTDDVASIRVKKKGRKGPGGSLELDFSKNCTVPGGMSPVDLTHLFTPGANQVTLVLRDRCGVAYSSLPYYLAGNVAALPQSLPPQLGKGTNAGKHDDPVNTGAGNFVHEADDLTFPDHVYGLGWRRTYNSLDDEVGPLGQGWSTSLSPTLSEDEDGLVVLRDGDGRTLDLTPEAGGGYSHPAGLAGDLTRNPSGDFTVAWYSGETWTFSADGRLAATRNWDGQEVMFAYSDGRLTAAAGAYGYGLGFAYDGAGRLISATASDGRQVTYSYGPAGPLERFTDPAGGSTGYSYNEDGRLAQVTDPDGKAAVKVAYAPDGRVSRQTVATGAESSFAYDDTKAITGITDESTGTTVAYAHDSAGQLLGVTDPTGAASSRSYDAAGNPVSGTLRNGAAVKQSFDARGGVTAMTLGSAAVKFVYDAQGRLTELTDAVGGVAQFTYVGSSRMPSTVTDPTGGVTRYELSGILITSTTDPDGVTTRFGYDERGNLTSVTDGNGAVTGLEYDGAGRMVRATSATGAVQRFTYDSAGRVTEEINPTGATARLRWSPAGRLLEDQDPTGARVTLSYNAAGLVERATNEVAGITTYEYDDAGLPTAVTNPEGGVTRLEWDALGRLVAETAPTGGVTRHGYDVNGNEVSTTDPLGGEARRTYDERGLLTEAADATGATIRYRYDQAGRVVGETDPSGGVTRIDYDASGRVTATVDPLGATSKQRWTLGGRLASTEDPLGSTTRYAYDKAGRLAQVTSPGGGVTRYEYDAEDQLVAVTSPAGLVTRFAFDAAGQQVTETSPSGGVTRAEYSPRGDLTATIDPLGARQQFEYDAAGRLVLAVDANGGRTVYGYDKAGRLTSLTDARGGLQRRAYNAGGQLTERTDPLGRVTRYAYDAAGRLSRLTPAAGSTVELAYDRVGRLVTRQAGGSTVTYAYDANGRRVTSDDGAGPTRYSYDAAGRLLTATRPDGSVVASTYDPAGRASALRYPSGRQVAYTYDADGRLIALNSQAAAGPVVLGALPKTIAMTRPADPRRRPDQEVTTRASRRLMAAAEAPEPLDATFELDPDGRLLREALPGGAGRAYHYTAGRLVSFTQNQPGVRPTTRTTTFERDAAGRVVAETTAGKTTRYTYDPAGQLRSGAGGPDGPVEFQYDPTGNRTLMTAGKTTTSYRYDGAHQLVEARRGATATSYRYDDAGRLVEESAAGAETSTLYDPFGRMATERTVTGSRTVTRSFAYDGDDRLARMQTTNQTARANPGPPLEVSLRWTDDGGVPQVLTESGLTGDADFIYGYGRMAAATATRVALLSEDGNGSALSTPASLRWVTAAGYDPYGVATPVSPSAGADPAFGYRGELTTGGDVYLRARLYDPATGRFSSPDPLPGVPGEVTAANPYPYAGNDPLNRADPLGLRPTDATWNCPPGRVAVPPAAGTYGPAQCLPEQREVYGPFVPQGVETFEGVPGPSGTVKALECASRKQAKPKERENKCKSGKGVIGFVKKNTCEAHNFAKDHSKGIRQLAKVAEFGAFGACVVVTVGTCAVVGGAVVAAKFTSEVAIAGKITKANIAATLVDAALVKVGSLTTVAGAGDLLASRVIANTGSRFAGGVYKWGFEVGVEALGGFGSMAAGDLFAERETEE